MNVVDSSGWLEHFTDGPNARHFAPIICDTANLIVPTICIYEVMKVTLRESSEKDAFRVCAAMKKGTIADFTIWIAAKACKISLAHHLPLADSAILASNILDLTAQPFAPRLIHMDEQGVLRWNDTNSEVALFGVNYYAPMHWNYRDLKAINADIEKVIDEDVAHFARMGLGALRLHTFDRQISDREGNLLDNEHLRLLDYLIARAAERGIYTVLTPIAWWGVLDTSPGFSTSYSMHQMTTDPKAREPQRRYLAQFVSHVNRYTKIAYKDDPRVICFELINEPLYPQGTTDAQVTEYINALADAIRATGCRKPIFYNAWGNRQAAVGAAKIEGATFGWYPTGLVAGKALRRDCLPSVDQYPSAGGAAKTMRAPELAAKAKIIYEFDAADVPGSYMYPAMARAFRGGGAQIAAQFQYDPLPLAAFNKGWQTHYLNLVYAPGKAISFLIAAEAFRRLPRHGDYGRYPQSARFAPFRVSYEEDLSEMIAEREFFHSNTTRSEPPAPDKLTRVIGCGSSPLIEYEGTGAYFLEKLSDGAWRLEVYPDAVWVNDPYGRDDLNREVSRIYWREQPMQIRLRDLGPRFSAEPLNEGNPHRAQARDGRLPIRPGVFILLREELKSEAWREAKLLAMIGLREFHAPAGKAAPPAVWHEAPREWLEGKALPVSFAVAAPCDPERVTVALKTMDGESSRRLTLAREQSYRYSGAIPGDWLKSGQAVYALEAQWPNESASAAAMAQSGPGVALLASLALPSASWKVAIIKRGAPVALFDAGRDSVRTHGQDGHRSRLVTGMSAGRKALRIEVDKFSLPPSAVSFRCEADDQLEARRDDLSHRQTLLVRARAATSATKAIEIVLIERDNSPWGTNVPLTTDWKDIRVPLSTLRYFTHWVNADDTRLGKTPASLRPENLSAVNVCFGAWLFPGHTDEPHGIEIESITLE
ncbi:MAG: cellulase family glycosylhydrolase [Candidatus Sumerlaeota bacterium]|nr:cellulase family glycosylhydrolase [Candidatus Sumerlaeota bacterium]